MPSADAGQKVTALQMDVHVRCTVYTYLLRGYPFAVFVDQQPSAKGSSHENLDQSGNESAVVKQLHHKNEKTSISS